MDDIAVDVKKCVKSKCEDKKKRKFGGKTKRKCGFLNRKS